MTVERSAPTFYTVPAGAKPMKCRSPQCGATIYFVDSPKSPGKKLPIDCGVVGGRVPSPLESGSGIIHFISCTDPDAHREKRPPARRAQRELAVDQRPRQCILCGCTNDKACVLTLEEAGIAGDELPDGVIEVEGNYFIGCSWVQLDPPICNSPSCLEKRRDLPLRMRNAKTAEATS